jgi:hypothetical protein
MIAAGFHEQNPRTMTNRTLRVWFMIDIQFYDEDAPDSCILLLNEKLSFAFKEQGIADLAVVIISCDPPKQPQTHSAVPPDDPIVARWLLDWTTLPVVRWRQDSRNPLGWEMPKFPTTIRVGALESSSTTWPSKIESIRDISGTPAIFIPILHFSGA